jgi:hypothetical protein
MYLARPVRIVAAARRRPPCPLVAPLLGTAREARRA